MEMNKQKLFYLSPATETLVVRFEGSVLAGSLIFADRSGRNKDYDEDEIDDLGTF